MLTDVEPVRDAVLRAMREEGIGWSELASRLGYWRSRTVIHYGRRYGPYQHPDTSRVKRMLGVSEPRQRTSAAFAEAIARACNLDPIDVGL